MANLGNTWHLPHGPEPRGLAGMRDPIGATVPGTEVTICSGNQYQGDGNAGNQLQDGSAVFAKRTTDDDWTLLPLVFRSAAGNNKYYSATFPARSFNSGETVEYYLRIAYDDHDTTFVHAAGDASVTSDTELAARPASRSRSTLARGGANGDPS
jgi:hypothetical protein